MTHREGQWYGGTIHGKPKVTAPEKVSTTRQQYREGGNPWSNLSPAHAVQMRLDLEKIREEGGNVYAYGQRVENVSEGSMSDTEAIVSSAIGGTSAAFYVKRGNYITHDDYLAGKRQSKAPTVAAPRVQGTPKVKSTTATINTDRAAQNRQRQIDQHVTKLVGMPGERWDNYLKWNVPKAQRPMVLFELAKAMTPA